MTDDEYARIAKATREGQGYFKRFYTAPCRVSRGWDVTVNSDYPQGSSVQPYL